jgi:putative addiction module component (TIGR02574 family)
MSAAERLLSEVLALPSAERANFARRVLESLDPADEGDAGNDTDWQTELLKRADEVSSGSVAVIPWETARGNIQTELEKRRAGRSSP